MEIGLETAEELIIDLSECYCANLYDDGEIEKLFHFSSEVGNKHQQGGQSSQRFARIREQQIIQYFKKTDRKISEIKTNITACINFIYRNKFEKYLSKSNKEKILRFETTEYGGLSGIFQFRNKYI